MADSTFGRFFGGRRRFAATVVVTDRETGELVAKVFLKESYDAIRERDRRIHQEIDELAERAAQEFVTQLLESVP